METPKRAYKGKDTEMLLAISTIIASAISNETFLFSKHSNWKPPYFTTVQTNITNVLKKYVGVDSAAALRKATTDVVKLQAADFSALADIRASINAGFAKNKPCRKELFKDLGYDTYNNAARKHDQEALINFLMQFSKAATPEVQAELVAEDASPDTLTAVLAAADPFVNAETAQEGFKGMRPSVTAEAINAYNDIYEQVMSIAKNAARDFKNNPPVAKQFSYTHVLKLQGGDKGDDKGDGGTTPTT